MKRSNLHFYILFLISVILFTIVLLTDKRERSIVLRQNFVKTLSISNMELKMENVIVDPNIRMFQKNDAKNSVQDSSYLYYSTDRIAHCAPEVAIYYNDNNTFKIGRARNLKKGEISRLHVRIDGLHKILLNGKEIWKAPYINENNPDETER